MAPPYSDKCIFRLLPGSRVRGVNELVDESSWMQKSGSREYLALMRPLVLLLLRGIFGNRLTSLIFRTENFL